MDNFIVAEPWQHGTEYEYADTLEEAEKLKAAAPDGSLIYVLLGEQ